MFIPAEVETMDYKDVDRLRRLVSDRGRIEPRRKTGLTAKDQRKLTREIKRARHVALLPYTASHLRSTAEFRQASRAARYDAPRPSETAVEESASDAPPPSAEAPSSDAPPESPAAAVPSAETPATPAPESPAAEAAAAEAVAPESAPAEASTETPQPAEEAPADPDGAEPTA